MTGALPMLTPEEEARYRQIQAQRQAKAPPPMSAQEFELWYYQNVANAPEQTQYQQDQWKQFQQTPAGQVAPERGLSGGSFPGFMPTVRQAAGQPTYGYTAPKTPNYIAIYLDGTGKAIKSSSPAYALVDSAYMMGKGFIDENGNLTPEGNDFIAQQVFWPYAVYRGAEDFMTYGQQAAESDNWNDWFWNSVAAAGGLLGMYPGGSPRMQFRPKPMRTGYPATGGVDPRTGKPRVEPRIDPETGKPLPDIESKPVYRSHANDLLLDPQSPLARAGNNPLTYRRWTELLIQYGVTKEEIRWMTNEMRHRYGRNFDPQKTYVTRQELAEIQYSSMPNLEVRAMTDDAEQAAGDARPVPLVGEDKGYDGPYEWEILRTPKGTTPRYYRVIKDSRDPRGAVEVQISSDGKTWEHGWGYGHSGTEYRSQAQVMRDINNDLHRWRSSQYEGYPQKGPPFYETQGPSPVDYPQGDRNSRPGAHNDEFSNNPALDNYRVITVGLLDDAGNPIDLPQKPSHPQDRNAIAFAPATDGADAQGRKILRVHELQSDAEAAGRREGYGHRRGQADPRMPYQSPREWTKALVRAILSHAARNGYDGVQFPTYKEVSGRRGDKPMLKEQYDKWLPLAIEEVSKELGIPPSSILSTPASTRASRSAPRAPSPHTSPAVAVMNQAEDDLIELFESNDIVGLMELEETIQFGRYAPSTRRALEAIRDEYNAINQARAARGQGEITWYEFTEGIFDQYQRSSLAEPKGGSGFILDPQTRRRIVEQGLRISRMDPTMSGEEPTSAYG